MLTGQRTRPARLVVEPVELSAPPGELVDRLAGLDDPAFLDSSARDGRYGRYSTLACSPLEVISLREGVLRDRSGAVLAAGSDEAIWAALGRAFAAVRAPGDPRAAYLPGWIGYVGYEVGRHVERLPGRAVRDTSLPDLRLAFYDALLLHDALERRWSLVELELEDPPPGAGAAGRTLRELAARAAAETPAPDPPPEAPRDADIRSAEAGARSNFSPADYRRAVRRCIDYIAAGDIFQVNLSQRFCVDDAPPPAAIYRALRGRNPAWYAGFLSFESGGRPCAVLSSSPELFLRVRGGHVVTRPIKGTRRRTGRGADDRAARADLLASPKDNAELAMIVDLLRNDLGRLCRFGSIRVTERRRLEAHPTVYHLVATVEGDVPARVGPAELLRATFPGGSITGAPKIRAMEIIDELEGVARGVYTGCLGIVCADGTCEWNIAIRTIVYDAGRALVQAGGGIVADSDPAAEYQETLDKARAMLEAIAEARMRESVPHAGTST